MENTNQPIMQASKRPIWLIVLSFVVVVILIFCSWFFVNRDQVSQAEKDTIMSLIDEKFAQFRDEFKAEQNEYLDAKFLGITEIVNTLVHENEASTAGSSLLASAGGDSLFQITSDNLIRNSSFEVGTGGKPSQWNYVLESTDSNTYQSGESLRSGKYGLKFDGRASTFHYGISQPVTKTVPGRTYTMSLYMKSVNAAPGTTLRFGFWNEYFNRYAYMEEVQLLPTQDWSRVSIKQTTSGSSTDWSNWYPIIEVRNLREGSVYIDDILLTEGDVLTAYSSATASSQNNYASLLGNGSVLISAIGTMYPAEDGVGSLGTTSNRWQDLYLTNASINENGDMTVAGDMTIGDNLTVNGDTTLKGDITFGDTEDDTFTFYGSTSFPGGITVGANGEFVINDSGNITKVNGVTYSYPSSQGSATTVLINDGAGNLSWGTFGAASVTADSLDFAQFVDAMTVDADTSINLYDGSTSRDLRFYNSNTGAEVVYLDGSNGNVGVGTTDTAYKLNVSGTLNTSTFYLSNAQVTSSAGELNYVDGASASTGGVVFGNGTNFTQDGANLFWDDSTNRLGIGTTNPSVSLEVNGDIKLLNGYDYYFGSIGLNDTGTSRTTSGASKIGTFDEFTNSASMTVQDVLDDLDASITSFAAGAGDIEAVGSMTAGAVFADTDADDQWLGLGINLGRIEFDNEVVNEVNILDANVGIGTTTPQYTLDVSGNIRATSEFYKGSVALGSTESSSGATLIGYYDNFSNASGPTVQDALLGFDTALGDRNFTNSLLLTDNQTVTAALNTLNVAIGTTAYGSSNYVTIGDNMRDAITDLDGAIAIIASGTSVSWTDAGTFLYPTSNDYIGNPSSGIGKVRGMFLGTTAPLVFGSANNYRMIFDGTNFILGDTSSTFLAVGDSGTTANFNFNNNQFYIRGDGAIGIGTTSPSSALTVVGTVTGTDFSCTDCLEAGNIATGAVATAEILDGTILTGDIGTDTILAGNIATGAIGTLEIADGTVSSTDILDGTILTGDISADTILAGDIATGAVATAEILDGTILTGDIGTDTILAGNIATGAVGTLEIADGTVSSTDILDGTILTGDISADTILAGDIATGAVATAEILDGTILTGDIGTDTILAGNIATGAIGTLEIADGTVSSTDILDSTILTGDIGLDTILAADIAADAIGSSEIAADSVGDSELFNTGTWNLTSTLNITGGDLGLGISPVVKLDIDTGSNTDGIRLRGLAETIEIADMYIGSGGQLVFATTNSTDTSAFIEVDPKDNEYGFIIRDSSTPSTVFANLYMVDSTGPDYLNILADSSNSLATGLVINDAGRVGIGTTPNNSYRLSVLMRSTDNGIYVKGPNSQFTGEDNGGQYCDINATNGGMTCASDISLKKDIMTSPYGLDAVNALRGVSYRWNSDSESDQVKLGFIAQEVEQIIPELVSVGQNGKKGINYASFAPILVNAINEQQNMFEDRYDQLGLVDSSLSSRLDQYRDNSLNGGDILGIKDEMTSLDEEVHSQRQEISSLQQQMDDVFSIVHTAKKEATEEADLTALTDRISFLEQMVLGVQGVSATSTEEATSEAQLEDTAVLEGLTVSGKTNLFDLGVVGDMSVGQIVVRGMEATINSLTDPLQIQSEASAPVEIMGAKVVIDTDGSLSVKETVKAKKFEVDDSEKESASIGEGIMKVGETEVIIESSSVTNRSKIFLTPTTEIDLPLAVVERTSGKSFKVKVTKQFDRDVSFNWWIVN